MPLLIPLTQLKPFFFVLHMANGNVGIEERMHLVWDLMVVSFCDSLLNKFLSS
jgi:hypothetical protein